VGPPKGGTPKTKTWNVETHNAILRTITCLLDFLEAISNHNKFSATKLGPIVNAVTFHWHSCHLFLFKKEKILE